MNWSTGILVRSNSNKKQVINAIFLSLVAFLTYASVYAYRKPFTIATFDGLKFWGISYQTLLIISQVTGYMLSKFYGIRFIAELKKIGRWKTAVVLIATAWLALFLFAIAPPPYGMLFLFLNGFALGFMWGIVFSYVEGRRATDFIGSVMAISFIFAGGFTRSVGKWLMIEWNINKFWMPFMTGLIFVIPLLIFIFLLERMPAPNEMDEQDRTVRMPMNKNDRQKFLQKFGIGLMVITVSYLFLTVMRDLRDNYMSNLWTELGYGNDYSIFTKTEINTSLILLFVISMFVLIRKNIIALRIVHLIIIAGFLIAAVSSWLFINDKMNGPLWMQLTGVGLYLGYIPFNCIVFERLIATFRIKGNAGFLIYFADAFGYLGSAIVMLSKELFKTNISWSQFYSNAVVIACLFGLAGTIFSFNYFNIKYNGR